MSCLGHRQFFFLFCYLEIIFRGNEIVILRERISYFVPWNTISWEQNNKKILAMSYAGQDIGEMLEDRTFYYFIPTKQLFRSLKIVIRSHEITISFPRHSISSMLTVSSYLLLSSMLTQIIFEFLSMYATMETTVEVFTFYTLQLSK